jgi:hypothetical protein
MGKVKNSLIGQNFGIIDGRGDCGGAGGEGCRLGRVTTGRSTFAPSPRHYVPTPVKQSAWSFYQLVVNK